ncbi:ABC transporter permease [Alkalihalophilus pseudofirmus]|uniref:ABC transporter permease n=1 Tax=Alkalihalobacterium alkalinitrilicum TaxID=427920 RepID=UPI00094D7C28|nr:ABC transporter permease [Alkalihalobacterium alkalinitrilicum]OLO42465.1 ABC transporter permease [Alkalihalophilus pseudofirmus]
MDKNLAIDKEPLTNKQISIGSNALKQSIRVFKKDKLAMTGAIIIAITILVAILAPVIAPYDPNVTDGSKRLLGMGTPGHILGLDDQGRDILSRLIWGGRLSLVSAIVPILIMFAVSLTLGLVAGYFERLGEVIMRLLDILFAFPMVLLAVAIAAIVGSGMTAIMLSICLVLLPYMTRVVYTSTVNEKTKEYVEAAKALGANKFEILFKEILPNVVSDLIVYATTLTGVMIVFAAGLSFLGLGIQPPHADWGRMTAGGLSVLTQGAPHVATIPGLVILIIATAFNWLGDGLRDALDPFKRTQ